MAKGQKAHPPEVKEQVIADIEAGKARAKVAAHYEVPLPTVNLWMAKHNKAKRLEPRGWDTPAPVAPQPAPGTPEAIQRRLELLELENDYLKKRLAIYEQGDD